jgi:AcrR family transcriptional regulator
VATTKRAPAGAAVLRGDITAAIRNAVMHELAEVGYGRLSIEAVARRAGVGKTAIYRRWSNKLEGGRCRCPTPAASPATCNCSP